MKNSKFKTPNSKLAAVLIAFGFLLSAAAQVTVNFPLLLMTGSTNDTTINIRAKYNPVLWHGRVYWFPFAGTNLATAGGTASIALVPNDYIVVIAGVPQAWTLHVTNSAAALSAVDITTDLKRFSGVQTIQGRTNITVTGPDANGVVILDASASNNISNGGTVSIFSGPGLPVSITAGESFDNFGNDVTIQAGNGAIGGGNINITPGNKTTGNTPQEGHISLNGDVGVTGLLSGNGGGLTNVPGYDAISSIYGGNATVEIFQINTNWQYFNYGFHNTNNTFIGSVQYCCAGSVWAADNSIAIGWSLGGPDPNNVPISITDLGGGLVMIALSATNTCSHDDWTYMEVGGSTKPFWFVDGQFGFWDFRSGTAVLNPPGGYGALRGDAAAVVNLNGAAISKGTIPAARLPGITTNLQFTFGNTRTNTLYFTNGTLMRVSQP